MGVFCAIVMIIDIILNVCVLKETDREEGTIMISAVLIFLHILGLIFILKGFIQI